MDFVVYTAEWFKTISMEKAIVGLHREKENV